jgi:hypothetical protein
MAATAGARTVVAAAGARDATRLEQLVCFFSFPFLFYYTNVYFSYNNQSPQHQMQAETVAIGLVSC